MSVQESRDVKVACTITDDERVRLAWVAGDTHVEIQLTEEQCSDAIRTIAEGAHLLAMRRLSDP